MNWQKNWTPVFEYPDQIMLWEWNPEPPVPMDDVLCPHCHEWSRFEYWKLVHVPGDECGEHPALRCPVCKFDHDHVWADPFEVAE